MADAGGGFEPVEPGEVEALLNRLLLQLDFVESGCWLWTGGLSDGYGKVSIDQHMQYVHRVMYELLVGEIPAGLTLDHLCRVRACANPDHLEPVTNYENNRRSNSATAINARKTVCVNGHVLISDLLGRRICQVCKRVKVYLYYADNRDRLRRDALERYFANHEENKTKAKLRAREKRGVFGADNRDKTHCPAGHLYSEENTYRDSKGRQCKICKIQRQRERRARLRGAL